MQSYWQLFSQHAGYVAFAIALGATLVSLALSEVFGLVPCVLCWYQRVAMYPLPIIIGVGILRRDRNWISYAWPLVAIGTAIALYHTLLQWNIIPEAAAPCQAGISCTTKHINYFNFITIPFGSLVSFLGIAACMISYKQGRGGHE